MRGDRVGPQEMSEKSGGPARRMQRTTFRCGSHGSSGFVLLDLDCEERPHRAGNTGGKGCFRRA